MIDNQEIADALIAENWNVKIKDPREAGDIPFMFLPVKIKFNGRGPAIYLAAGSARNRIAEEDVSILDKISISNVDLDVRPYDWELNGKTGRTAYLQSMEITQEVDRFMERYAEEECPE